MLTIGAQQIKEMEDYAVNQNLTTLRNRVNELGVAEPMIQKQGRNRIVVELPGVQDTAEAKRILGKTANLEFRLEARPDAASADREQFEFRDQRMGERSAWLERDLIIGGDRVTGATSSFDENGRPQVNINLDSQGGTLMNRATRDNIKRRMAVLFLERKTRTVGYEKGPDGLETPVLQRYDEKKIISLATIQSALGTQFRITGLDSPAESAELALLLRSGALAAPLDFVEERAVGPSLGADNIRMGVQSLMVGAGLVFIATLVLYRMFGVFAVLALVSNVLMLIAAMSLLSATLTLPGIAGIVLTVGMAVDANVHHQRADPRGAEQRHAAALGDRGRLRPRLADHHGFQPHDADRGRDPLRHRHRSGARLRGDAVDRHPDLDVHLRGGHAGAGEPGLRRPPPHEALDLGKSSACKTN